MKVTILGCGSSGGVPMGGGFWGVCDPNEPRNERTRSSALVQSATTNILIDAGQDLRTHLNRMKLQRIDGLLLTHAHSDHINGLEDLRAITYQTGKKVKAYSNAETIEEVDRLWPHTFSGTADHVYPASLSRHVIANYDKFRIGDIDIESIEQDHKVCTSLGFRFGSFAYSVDFAYLNDKSLECLQGIETWFVGCAGYHREKPINHATLKQVLEWAAILQPKMTYLGVLTTHMDYKTLCDELPPHIRPGYDGLEIDISK